MQTLVLFITASICLQRVITAFINNWALAHSGLAVMIMVDEF